MTVNFSPTRGRKTVTLYTLPSPKYRGASCTGASGAEDRMWHNTDRLKVSGMTAIQKVRSYPRCER